jgi:hypothetical protein
MQAGTANCTKSVVQIPRLQNAESIKILRLEVDEDGIWFVINKNLSSSALGSENILGLSRVEDNKSWMPHPNTMSKILKRNRPNNPLSFVAHPDGVLRLDEYLILISQDKLPIGFDGLYLHDVLDHSLGYALLAETPAWPKLKRAIQLTIESQKRAPGKSPAVETFLVKINAFLEATTTALPEIYENPNKIEQADEYQLIYRQVDRLLERAIEINSFEPTK